MQDVKDKVAIVTGGGSGMGRIIARRLADRGARVALFDVNEAGMAETAGDNSQIVPFSCDISDSTVVAEQVSRVTNELGPVELLAHAAALMPSHKLADETNEGMERLFQINYFGTVYMVKAVLPGMLERNSGRIIAFGSIAGHAPVPNMGAYCATKSAVNMYMEVLHNELRHTDIKTHLICPPAVNTPLIDQTLATDSPGSIIESKNSGRLADPEKIVDAIDKGVAKGKSIIYPGEARLLLLWHTLFPGLWWKTVLKFED